MKSKIDGEILAVVPEFCSGPGWANTPVYVYWQDEDGVIKQRCLQPDQQSRELAMLFDIGAVVQAKLKKAVEGLQE